MTFTFPESLNALRKFLKSNGFEGGSIKTSRHAAFVAQQLLGTRMKFPPAGQDMMPTLLAIQGKMLSKKEMADAEGEASAISGASVGDLKQRHKSQRRHKVPSVCDYSVGVHIFCDGACEPNPGAGGWGVVVYRDGVEVANQCGGDPETTNNQMELTALLVAIEKANQLPPDCAEVTIWCDSQYCVKGANEWLKGWKANGWNRKKPNSPNRAAGEIKNLELWQAIDAALGGSLTAGSLAINWVKGHAGIAGNERADELAEKGRREALHGVSRSSWDDPPAEWAGNGEDLDERYRQIMGAA